MPIIFSEDFNGNAGSPQSSSNGTFTAVGFQSVPTAGQLDSDYWRINGFSDLAGLLTYGATGASATDYGRGAYVAQTTAGVYYVNTGVAALGASSFIIKPTAAEFGSPAGTVTLRVQYTGATTLTGFTFDFDGVYRNSQGRDSFLNFTWAVQSASTQPTTFSTNVGALGFTTPIAADALGWQRLDLAAQTFNTTINSGDYIFLRWSIGDNGGGAGSRDEIGFDNIVLGTVEAPVTSNIAVTPTALSQNEGNSGATPYTFNVTRSDTSANTSVTAVIAGGQGFTAADIVSVTVDGIEVPGFALGTPFQLSFSGATTNAVVAVNVLGDLVVEPNETFTLTLTAPTGGYVLGTSVATGTVVNDDVGPIAIYTIQGSALTSPLVGQTVTTRGIVTAVDTNGFYIQDATGDGNPGTSDGVFVFTSTAPPASVVVGNLIDVTGTVTEFAGSTAGSATVTEITSPTVALISTGNALPAPVLISGNGGGIAPPTQVISPDGIGFWEALEGMRVTIRAPLVVAGTNSFGETYVVASGGAGATGVNDRGGITLSSGDFNPEKIQIDDDSGIFAGYVPNHTQGDILSDVTGIVNYAFAEYELIVTQAVTTTTDVTLTRETTNLAGDATRISYASFNMENFDPTDPASKVALLASEVVNGLRSPDIIGAQEIQDADGAGTGTNLSGTVTAQLLIDAIAALGGPTYRYIEVAPAATNTTGGEPNGNIRNGFFFNPARVTYVEGSAVLIDTAAYAGSRRPLVADFLFNGERITAIDLHSTSRGGSDPLWGVTQPPADAGDSARTAQANGVRAYIDAALAIDPARKFVVNGDFNGFYFETALQNLTAGGVIANLYDTLPVQERYSYIFQGNYQTLDHILVSGSLLGGSTLDIVHENAFLPAAQQATDHDQPVATIGLARSTGAAVAVADGYTTTEAAFYRGTVLANDAGGSAGLVVATVNGVAPGALQTLASGAKLLLLADGTFTYDPDGAFAALNNGGTASDSFTYTLPGGSSATATITITGISGAGATAGNDTITGTPADDSFDLSNGGNDTASGGAGNDAFFFGAAFTGADRVNGGSGANDQVGLQGDYTGGLVLNANSLTNVEVLAALPGFSYNITSNDGNVAAGQELAVFGGNLLAGQNFTFNGSAETDGRVRMFGGLGTDSFTGGAQDDGFYFGPGKWGAGDTVVGGAGTNDQIGLDGDYTITLDARADVEAVVLLGGPAATPNNFNITVSDAFTGAGLTRTVFATAVTTALVIDGTAEADGNLKIYGGQAADVLTGGAGNDLIFGNLGADTLRGNAGIDTFLYDAAAQSTSTAYDRLVDFNYGTDLIKISGQVHDSYALVGSGTLSTATFDSDLATALNADLTGGKAVFFTPNVGALSGSAFLVIDANGIDGYQAGQDYVFEVPNPPPVLPPADFIIP